MLDRRTNWIALFAAHVDLRHVHLSGNDLANRFSVYQAVNVESNGVTYGQFTSRNSKHFARCTVPILQRGAVSISGVAVGVAQGFGRMAASVGALAGFRTRARRHGVDPTATRPAAVAHGGLRYES